MARGLVHTTSGLLNIGGKMPNKKLGQHWLKDRLILEAIADSAELNSSDTVLEIGPGLGTLTSILLKKAGRVVAVEYDVTLAQKLPGQFPGTELEVIQADILQFDLTVLPKGYKVVANVPYYITQKILERLLYRENQPETLVVLVQQEVAEKLVAPVGNLSAIAVKLQLQYDVHLGTRVQKEYFIPPPQVDSQVLVCKKTHVEKNVQTDIARLFSVIDAGFSAPRKKLRTALAGGLGITKSDAEQLLKNAGVDPDRRAGAVPVADWRRIQEAYDTGRSA